MNVLGVLRIWLFILGYCMNSHIYVWAKRMYLLSYSFSPENRTWYKTVRVNPMTMFCPSVMSMSSLLKCWTKQKSAFGLYQSSWFSLWLLRNPRNLSHAGHCRSWLHKLRLSSVRYFAGYCSSPTYQHDHIWWVQTFGVLHIQSLEWWIKGAEESQMFAVLASTRLTCSWCKACRSQFQSK